MQRRKIVTELINIHRNRQFMAFPSCEVVLINQQHPTAFSFINLEAIERERDIEQNYKNAFELK